MTKSDERFQQCIHKLYGLRRFGIILGLAAIEETLAGLDHPQRRFRTVHVAGTNGKGSVASALSTLLMKAGYRVGLYTSPHLVRLNERFCVNNRPISDADVCDAFEAVDGLPKGERELTFFEYTTAMAFYEFARQAVDWAVIETGMGGRLDATNIVDPDVAVITGVSLEHREYLGETLSEIAGEKAGIIKPGRPVVTGAQLPEAVARIRGVASEKGAPFFRLNEHFSVHPIDDEVFDYNGIGHRWAALRFGLSGAHQMANAAVVAATCEALMRTGAARIGETVVREGLAANRWPGRLEVVTQSPLLILDGAHNLEAAEHLANHLRKVAADKRLTLVLGILDDKPYVEMFRLLLPLCDRAILTKPRIYRAMPLETLSAAARDILPNVEAVPRVDEAVRRAISAAEKNDVICLAGSLYVIGEAKEALEADGYPAFSLAS